MCHRVLRSSLIFLMGCIVVAIAMRMTVEVDGLTNDARRDATEASRRHGVRQPVLEAENRVGDCAVLDVSDASEVGNGVSVSLGRRDGKWYVRKVGRDFDVDSLRVASGICP